VDLDRAAAEHPGRIQIGVAGPDAEVEPLLGGAQDLTLADLVPRRTPTRARKEWLVRSPSSWRTTDRRNRDFAPT